MAKVEGFWSADSQGRKAYRKGRVIKCVVEFGSLTLDSLILVEGHNHNLINVAKEAELY